MGDGSFNEGKRLKILENFKKICFSKQGSFSDHKRELLHPVRNLAISSKAFEHLLHSPYQNLESNGIKIFHDPVSICSSEFNDIV